MTNFLTINKYLLATFCENLRYLYPLSMKFLRWLKIECLTFDGERILTWNFHTLFITLIKSF